MAKSKYDPTGSEIDTTSSGAFAPRVPTDIAADDGSPSRPPNPTRKYIGVQSPSWQQSETGYWYYDPGYQRTTVGPNTRPDEVGTYATLNPQYYEGDEYALISGMGASPEAIAAIQAKMAEARLMPKEYRVGTWDADTTDAFKYVLAYANQTTTDWQTALDSLLQGSASLPPIAGPKGPTFTAHLSNSDDVKKAFKDVTYQLLGGQFVDPAQADAFVESFHAQELGAQRAAFNAATGGGGTVEDAPNLGTAAETQLETTDKAGIQAKRYNDIANVLGSILQQKAPAT